MNIPYGIQMQFASETWSGEGDYLSITEEFIVCSGIGLFVNMKHYGTRPADTLQKLTVLSHQQALSWLKNKMQFLLSF